MITKQFQCIISSVWPSEVEKKNRTMDRALDHTSVPLIWVISRSVETFTQIQAKARPERKKDVQNEKLLIFIHIFYILSIVK